MEKAIFKDNARPKSEHKTKERVKRNGEVFTPIELVNEMLDQIPAEMWLPGKTVLEPAAGNGNFVIEVLKRKLAAGCTPLEAITDMYAVEFMLDNVDAMKNRIYDLLGDTPEIRQIVDDHIVHANTLDPDDVTDGRRFPDWLRDTPKPEPVRTLDSFFNEGE